MPKTSLRFVTRARLTCGLALCLVFGTTVQAQEAAAGHDESTKQLLDRVQELEAKVKQLEGNAASPVTSSTATAPVPAPTPEPVAEVKQVNAVADRLKLLLFGDTGFHIGRFYGPSSTFEFGEFDIFATARLTDRVTALAEVLFTADHDNALSVDIERLTLNYHQNDYLNATIGRIHNAIGYYNTAFHRGDYFQTAIGRPTMFEYDDQGGFLPLQDLGVVLNGQLPSGGLGLNYVFEVTNGRAYDANGEPAQNHSDLNISKAVNFGLSAKPGKVPGLVLGFSVRHDYLSDALDQHVSEIIPDVYAVFTNSKYEWLNEAMYITHALPGGPRFHTTAFYSQFSRRFGHYRPYFRYDYVNSPVGDSIYDDPLDLPIVGRINGPTVGLRWDFTRYTALKAQYVHESLRGEPSTNGANLQFDFTF